MIRILLTLSIFAFAGHAFAKGDLERVAGFYFNLYSGGTYLADLEGQKQNIKMQMEKEKAQLLLATEQEVKTALTKNLKVKLGQYEAILTNQKNALVET